MERADAVLHGLKAAARLAAAPPFERLAIVPRLRAGAQTRSRPSAWLSKNPLVRYTDDPFPRC